MPSSLVDTHVHLWDLGRRAYPWIAEHPVLNETHGIDRFDAECGAVPVKQFVFVECTVSFDDEVAREEVRWARALAEEDPRLRGIVAHASLEKGAAIRPHLEWLAERPLVRGVRRLIQEEPDPSFCLQDAFVEGVRLLAELDFTFDLCVYPDQLPQVIELVRQCPEVQFVLDHLGKPAIRDGAMDPWRARIRTLAECPNVACKVSGALTEADPDAWTPDVVQPYLEHVIRAFGSDRVMFGGDWPVVKRAAPYPEWVGLVRDAVRDCPPADQRRLFRETAERVYRLDE
jgi:L-fuconolactonase